MSLNLATLVRAPARERPEQTALVFGDAQLSYRALDEVARRMAGGLRTLGVQPGQHVAIFTPNVPAFSVAYFGCHYAACPVVPVNVLLAADEIAFLLKHSDAVAFIVWERLLPQAQEALAKAGTGAKLIVAKADPADISAPTGAHSMSALLGAGHEVTNLPTTMPDDTAVILYTSGTTGRPKGAELTHFNMFYNADCAARQVLSLTPDTVALACLPLTHSFGQTIMHNAVMRVGGKIVLLPRFEPRTALTLMQQHRVTFFGGVPSMYMALLQEANAAPYDVSSLQWCAGGGASTPMEVLQAFRQRFGVPILEGYGLSETSPAASFNMPYLAQKPGSVGVPLYGVEFRLERADGTIVTEPHEPGEICIKGHNVMKGYYKQPEETKSTIKDGWFHTGDVGVRDEEGYYRIVDRLKDMILFGGYNVYPREVEEVLYAHPAIAEAAVIGVPSPTQGEEVKAFVALHPGASVTEQELITYCRERMAIYKYPRSIELRSELPKGPTGKIVKQALRSG
ncbi:long-chain-fatty-acid--CoA ligase [Sorangium sp. So ce1000]|uniref:long-chain-fatty-acid--CoA ligase n=1 Tax=Sorangium sp. So ce1000 TaxID=3133325 RepID=UPI003F5D88C7